jgi:hypothetical protein
MNILTTHTKLVSTLASVLALLILAMTFVFATLDRQTLTETYVAQTAAVEQTAEQTAVKDGLELLASLEDSAKQDVLWLARVIYSETKRPYEQELVAWTVRNRVETGYRGQTTYRGVVLDPWQFSAFNANGPKRGHYVGLGETSAAKGWATAVAIAYDVVRAPAYERPFAQDTRHFYSEVSMVGRSHPAWATGKRPVSLDREIDPKRFRFFRAIA